MTTIQAHARAALCTAAAAALLAGCAAINSVSADVSTYGDWPADRKPGSYAYERLPSQQADSAASDALEAAAAGALQKAGFTPVSAGQQPDVLVQVGARDARAVLSPWDDPLWWGGGFGYWRHGPWMSPRWGMGVGFGYPASPRYERTVALLMRDRASGKPLFEARASSEGNYRSDAALLQALFDAALVDFPRTGVNPRRVVVPLAD